MGATSARARAADTALFRPHERDRLDLPRAICIYVGRVAVEKNLEAMLEAELPGTRLIVGDGRRSHAARYSIRLW